MTEHLLLFKTPLQSISFESEGSGSDGPERGVRDKSYSRLLSVLLNHIKAVDECQH